MELKGRLNTIAQVCLGVLFLPFIFSFFLVPQKTRTGDITLSIEHVVKESILKLDSVTYKNALGQNFTVSKFKYYISNVILKGTNGSSFISEDYFLIDEEEPGSKKITLKDVAHADYSSIEFIIGVDSLHNCSGAQSGALDPVKGMFWAWNSGYIFLKLEGISSSSNLPAHLFEYHIGGYKTPNNCIRKIKLDLSKNKFTNNQEISMQVDVMELLGNASPVDFTKLPSVTDFRNATVIADNYKNMFRLLNN